MFDEAEVIKIKKMFTDLDEIKYENKNFLRGEKSQLWLH